ncbi:ubiquinone/menaquinone biosynthesis C-methylase UbiE [Kribbella antiqua]|uniref:Ubiquinone/menaquinone biosynthesis C-methylase UbiE n=1 Tax=Kribbella antiqua TaxID=2512217 RepID=A0A4R2IVY1_9ACTN|nr:class I SAM-dependent methyltransferase [Kribbella antiqua]TCO48516.1 ubiquinone/menaquinone biosynthesis C-methylase UbiE [Kribbella antiqua]
MTEWSSGDIYESYVGRWSRLVAAEFVDWLEQPAGSSWLDVGCGTGALTSTILRTASPASVLGVDPSEGFVDYARCTVPGATFEVRSAAELPDGPYDVVVSGLVLNFIPERVEALRRMREIGSTVAVYVWDYADGMQLMRHFWDAVVELHPDAREYDEARRFPFCTAEGLEELFAEAGFTTVSTRAIVVPTEFASFDDYWRPFLGGQGPAPAYVQTLSQPDQQALREAVRDRLPTEPDGSILLTARAWAALS